MISALARVSAWLTFALCLSVTTLAAELPHTFEAGQPARASEVNENFTAMADAAQATASDLAAIASATDSLSAEAAQIQSALDLTSPVRWVIADSYQRDRTFSDGVIDIVSGPSGDGFGSDFVDSVDYSFMTGVYSIRFSDAAAAGIANSEILVEPVDPGSGMLWFRCRGDGSTDVYLDELDCIFNDPAFEPYNSIRNQVGAALDVFDTSGAVEKLRQSFVATGEMPLDNAGAGLFEPEAYSNGVVAELRVVGVDPDNATVNVEFSDQAHPDLRSCRLEFSFEFFPPSRANGDDSEPLLPPIADERCTSSCSDIGVPPGQLIAAKYLPPRCRRL